MADIELVIKIDENTLKRYQESVDCEERAIVVHGTPLPKGHRELVDKNFIIQSKITRDNNGVSDRTKGWNEACQAIFENAPTVVEADSAK